MERRADEAAMPTKVKTVFCLAANLRKFESTNGAPHDKIDPHGLLTHRVIWSDVK
jgi:hypothetical protein